MRKMYIQPETEISKVEPTSIVCFSAGNGGSTGGNFDSGKEGDAPKRRTPVF